MENKIRIINHNFIIYFSVSLAIFVVRFIRNFGQKLETNVTLIDDVQGNEEYIKWLKSSKDKSSLTRDFKNFVNEERMVFVDEIKRNSVEFLDEFFLVSGVKVVVVQYL